MQTALSQFGSVSQQTKGTILQSQYALAGGTQTQDQQNATNSLELAGRHAQHPGRRPLSVFRPRRRSAAGRHRRSHPQWRRRSRPASSRSSPSASRPISAPAASAGWWSARRRATSVSLAEDAVSPFGFKLAGATTTDAGATVNGPSGTPPATVGRSRRDQSERRRHLQVQLHAAGRQHAGSDPDGDHRVAAGRRPVHHRRHVAGDRGQSPDRAHPGRSPRWPTRNWWRRPRSRPATISSTPTPAIRRSGSADRHSPPRPRWSTAAANTVTWYKGDNATDDPRSTALARADQSLTVSYGARANEQGLRSTVQNLAVFAATQFSGSDPNGEAQYSALQPARSAPPRRRPEPAERVRYRRPARRRPGRAAATPTIATTRPTRRCRTCCRASRARRPSRSRRRSCRCRRACRRRCRPRRCCCRRAC